MAFRGLTVLAVVPARRASKSIAGKNLRLVHGLSLVARAARTLADAAFIDQAVCSTDDQDIAIEARSHGLLVPDLRPAGLSNDDAKSVDIWRHAWADIERRQGVRYEASVLIEPTSPLRRVSDIENTLIAMLDSNASVAATVSPTPGHYTPHKTLTLRDDHRIDFYLADGARYNRRQEIPRCYHRNGVCYAARRIAVMERGSIIEHDCVPVVLDRPIVTINDALDLEIANFLLEEE